MLIRIILTVANFVRFFPWCTYFDVANIFDLGAIARNQFKCVFVQSSWRKIVCLLSDDVK